MGWVLANWVGWARGYEGWISEVIRWAASGLNDLEDLTVIRERETQICPNLILLGYLNPKNRRCKILLETKTSRPEIFGYPPRTRPTTNLTPFGFCCETKGSFGMDFHGFGSYWHYYCRITVDEIHFSLSSSSLSLTRKSYWSQKF